MVYPKPQTGGEHACSPLGAAQRCGALDMLIPIQVKTLLMYCGGKEIVMVLYSFPSFQHKMLWT